MYRIAHLDSGFLLNRVLPVKLTIISDYPRCVSFVTDWVRCNRESVCCCTIVGQDLQDYLFQLLLIELVLGYNLYNVEEHVLVT